MTWLARWMTGETPREDWVIEEPVVLGRLGEPIRSRVNATHLDRVCRAKAAGC